MSERLATHIDGRNYAFNFLKKLLGFAAQWVGKPASRLDFADTGRHGDRRVPDHLERDRSASARTRNARLAAIGSRFACAALRHPEQAALIQLVRRYFPASAETPPTCRS